MSFKNFSLYVFPPLLESQTFAISSPVCNNDLYNAVWKGSSPSCLKGGLHCPSGKSLFSEKLNCFPNSPLDGDFSSGLSAIHRLS